MGGPCDYLAGGGDGESSQESQGLQTGMHWGYPGLLLKLWRPHPGFQIQEGDRWRKGAEAGG